MRTLVLLLALAGSLPAAGHAQDFTTYDGRVDFVLETLGGPDNFGSWGTYTLGRLALDPDDAEALEQAVENVERLDNQSVPIGTIALAQHWDHFSEAQRQRMLTAMKSWREIDGHGTENHALMQNVCGYLFTQWFPDETEWTTNYLGPMASGPLHERIRTNLVTVASSLFDKGYVENLSTTYLMLHLYPWMMLQQFAADPDVRLVADAAIHFHLANLAANSFHGQVIAPYNRSNYQQQNTPQAYDAEGDFALIPQVPFLTWLYWGPSTHFGDAEALSAALRRYHGHVGFFAAMREGGPPAPVIQRVGAGGATPYTLRSSAADFGAWGSGEPHDNMRTIHRTEDYAIGTGFFRYVPGSYYINYVNFGILYDSADEHTLIDVNQNYWMSDLEETERWPKCTNSPFQQDAMHENTAITLVNVPPSDPWRGLGRSDWIANRDGHYDDLIERTDVRFPKTVDEVVERDGWVFLREGEVFVGIRPLREYTVDPDTLADFTILRSAGATNAVVFEVGTAAEHGSFVAFQDTLRANPLTVDWETLTVEYTDAQGDALHVRWVAPDYALAGGGERVLVRPELWLDGAPEPGLAPLEWPLLESPPVTLEGRVLQIQEGGERRVVDWTGELPVFRDETCDSGAVYCGASCADLATDPANCGACGQGCAGAEHAAATCVSSACGFECESGWSDCNGDAADGCEREGSCPVAEVDAGAPGVDGGAAEPVTGGCGCRTNGEAPVSALALGLVVLGALGRRRR